MSGDGRLDPAELGSSIDAESYDVEEILVAAEEQGLLAQDRYVLCPRCRTPMLLDAWQQRFEQFDEVECLNDLTDIPPQAEQVRLWRMPAGVKKAIADRMDNHKKVLVLCALDLERKAVVAHLADAGFQRYDDARYVVGAFAGQHAQWTVAVGVTGALMQSAAAAAAQAVATHSPDLAIFVGVAGALKDVVRGDVAVADQAVDVSGGKETEDGLIVRADAYRPTSQALEAARQVLAEDRWVKRIRIPSPDGSTPKAVIGPIGVSNRVIASDTGEISQALRRNLDKAVAVEMEGAGFLSALYRTRVDALLVRGMSDQRVDKREDEDTDWQPAAADHAAAFAMEVLRVW
jgi:nucleoside phosphorylase